MNTERVRNVPCPGGAATAAFLPRCRPASGGVRGGGAAPAGLSRREFLRCSALAAAGAAAGCAEAPAGAPDLIIDIHQHTNYGGKRDENGHPIAAGRSDAALVAHQQAMGVAKTILLPAGREAVRDSTHQGRSNGLNDTCTGNDACQKVARENPGSFYFGANEVPDLPEAAETLERGLEAGAVVIGEQKFGVECDAPEMQRLYELAAHYGVPILMHWQHERYNRGFERFYRMLEKYPKAVFIGHAQTWWANIDRGLADPSVLYPRTRVQPGGLTDRYLSDYPNLYGDLSANSGQGALSRDLDHARDFLGRHQDRLMFGSDCPDLGGKGAGCIGAGTIALVRRLAPSREIGRKILSGNARRLFRL